MSPIRSLEEATVGSQGREPLGTECVPRTKSPEGATVRSMVLSPLRGLDLGPWIPVQGLPTVAPFRGWARPAWRIRFSGDSLYNGH